MRCIALAVLLVACQRSPYGRFDAGHPVHVIVHAEGVSETGFRIEPVVTLGAQVAKSRPRAVRAGSPAVEVALFHAPSGRARLSYFDRATRIEGRLDLNIERETWVVVTTKPKTPKATLRVHRKPPHDKLGAWRPHVAVPD